MAGREAEASRDRTATRIWQRGFIGSYYAEVKWGQQGKRIRKKLTFAVYWRKLAMLECAVQLNRQSINLSLV